MRRGSDRRRLPKAAGPAAGRDRARRDRAGPPSGGRAGVDCSALGAEERTWADRAVLPSNRRLGIRNQTSRRAFLRLNATRWRTVNGAADPPTADEIRGRLPTRLARQATSRSSRLGLRPNGRRALLARLTHPTPPRIVIGRRRVRHPNRTCRAETQFLQRHRLSWRGLCCKPCSEVQERDCRSWHRGHAASSPIRSVTNCIVSARTQGPIPKARSTKAGALISPSKQPSAMRPTGASTRTRRCAGTSPKSRRSPANTASSSDRGPDLARRPRR